MLARLCAYFQKPPAPARGGSGQLERLPNELLAQVLCYLQDLRHDEESVVPEIRALCLTSKVLSAIATPVLYQNFDNTRSATTLGRFLRTIVGRPGLAKHVRRLNLSLWSGGADTALTSFSVILKAISPFVVEMRYYQALRRALRGGSYDAEMALLLMMATQVEELKLRVCDVEGAEANTPYMTGYEDNVSLVSQLLYLTATAYDNHADPFCKVLHRLKHADFGFSPDPSSACMIPSETVAPFFALPVLKSFVGNFIGNTSPDQVWWSDNTNIASNVRKLELHGCNLNTATTVAIIANCRALEALSIIWQSDLGGTMHRIEGIEEVLDLDFAEVSKALRAHEASLLHLRLDTFSGDDVTIAATPPMDSLRSFTKLKTLDIDDRLIYGDVLDGIWHQESELGDLSTVIFQLLPMGIESLTIRTRKHVNVFFWPSLLAIAGSGREEWSNLRCFSYTSPLMEATTATHVQRLRDDTETFASITIERHAVMEFEVVMVSLEHENLVGYIREAAALLKASREDRESGRLA